MLKKVTLQIALLTLLLGNCYAITWYREDISTYTFSLIDVDSTTMRMDLSELRDKTRFMVKDKDSTAANRRISNAYVDYLINMGQTQICMITGCLTDRFRTLLNPGTTEYMMPHQIIKVTRVVLKNAGEDDRDLLEEKSMKKMDKDYEAWEDDTDSDPILYYVRRDKIGFYQTPEDTGTCHIDAIVKPDWMNADTDYPFNDAPECRPFAPAIISYAVYKYFLMDGKSELAAFHKQEYMDWLRIIKAIVGYRPNYNITLEGKTSYP
jgi:hypothetical protein